MGIGLDGEVGTRASRVQVADGRTPADALGVVQGQGSYTSGIGGVVVWTVGIAGIAGGGVEGSVFGVEFGVFEATGADRASIAVVGFVAVVEIRFIHAEEGQEILMAPPIAAGLGPGVVVLGHAAQKNLRVFRTRAADDLATGDEDIGGMVGGPRPAPPSEHGTRAESPVPEVAITAVGVADLLGKRFQVGKIRAGIENEHGAVGILRKPGGDDGTGRACASDDDVVVIVHRPAGVRFHLSSSITT